MKKPLYKTTAQSGSLVYRKEFEKSRKNLQRKFLQSGGPAARQAPVNRAGAGGRSLFRQDSGKTPARQGASIPPKQNPSVLSLRR